MIRLVSYLVYLVQLEQTKDGQGGKVYSDLHPLSLPEAWIEDAESDLLVVDGAVVDSSGSSVVVVVGVGVMENHNVEYLDLNLDYHH